MLFWNHYINFFPFLRVIFLLFIPLALFLGLYAAVHDLDIEWITIKGISEYADGSSALEDAWAQFVSAMAAYRGKA